MSNLLKPCKNLYTCKYLQSYSDEFNGLEDAASFDGCAG